MNEHLDPTNHNYNAEELDLEKKLRPLSFDDFTGQDQVLENLKIFVQAANLRGEALDHTAREQSICKEVDRTCYDEHSRHLNDGHQRHR